MEKCAHCDKANDIPMLCGACSMVSYCDRDCQKAHWKTHKSACLYKKEETPDNQKISQPEKIIEDQNDLPNTNEKQNTAIKGDTTTKFEEYLEKLEQEEMKKPEVAKRMASFNRIKDFEILDEVGQGNFTMLYKVVDKKTQKEYALKVAEKARLIRMHKEKDLLVEKHCLTKLKDVSQVVKIEETFQDNENLYILLELIKGKELWHMANVFGFPDKARAYRYFGQILHAIKGIHERGIVHRDLKPENIMVCSETGNIKIIDFGSAKDVVEKVASKGNSSTGRVYFEHFMGTPNYMAPECIHNKSSDKPCDIYSLGCLFYNLLVGFPPFLGGSDYLIFTASLEKRIVLYPFIFTDEERDFIEALLNHEIDRRPPIEKVIAMFDELALVVLEKEEGWSQLSAKVIEEYVVKIRDEENWDEAKIKEEVEKVQGLLKELDAKHAFDARINDRIKLLLKQTRHYFKHSTFEHYASGLVMDEVKLAGEQQSAPTKE